MYNDRKVVLISSGGCGDGSLGAIAFRSLGFDVYYTNDPANIHLADLVILPGGADVDFTRYNGNSKLCGHPSPMMEAFDRAVLPIALKDEIPIFGICRGHQSLWVELGGKLEEDITDRHSKIRHMIGGHDVHGNWGKAIVNSLHHQAPKYPIPNSDIAIQMHAPDGTIEAFSYAGFAVAVQWHPEMMMSEKWVHLVTAAIKRETDRIPDIYGMKELRY